MTKDPAWGMQIDENQAAGKSEFRGQTYYFCSNRCQKKFEADPEQYTRKTA